MLLNSLRKQCREVKTEHIDQSQSRLRRHKFKQDILKWSGWILFKQDKITEHIGKEHKTQTTTTLISHDKKTENSEHRAQTTLINNTRTTKLEGIGNTYALDPSMRRHLKLRARVVSEGKWGSVQRGRGLKT